MKNYDKIKQMDKQELSNFSATLCAEIVAKTDARRVSFAERDIVGWKNGSKAKPLKTMRPRARATMINETQIDKQAVEEMDDVLRQIFGCQFAYKINIEKYGGFGGHTEIYTKNIARELVNVGYRRQSVGEWRLLRNMMCECSMCHDCFNYYSSTDLPNFCPNCGAKMKGGKV